MVLAYDQLEDRRTIDVIVTEFFPLLFKKAESLENLDILLTWLGKSYKVKKKGLAEALNRFEKQEEKKLNIKPFLLENDQFRKITRAVPVGSRTRLDQTQNSSS